MKSVAYGDGMISSKCRIGAMVALTLLLTTIAAIAQVPSGELPGRERERFREPEAPRAQPGGPTITLPSTVAPAGAEKVPVMVRDVEVVDSTAIEGPRNEWRYFFILTGRY
jgi:hypothetical protein